MKAYLINWRKEIFDWDFKSSTIVWSTGTNKSLSKGDYVFLIKLGNGARGLVAFGKTLSGSTTEYFDFKKKTGPGVKVRFIDKIEPFDKCLIDISLLKDKFPDVNWSSQNCISIPHDVLVVLLQLWSLKKLEGNIHAAISEL